MRIDANQTKHRAHFAGGIAVEGAGWQILSADQGATVKDSITMAPKRLAGGLSEGGIPFS